MEFYATKNACLAKCEIKLNCLLMRRKKLILITDIYTFLESDLILILRFIPRAVDSSNSALLCLFFAGTLLLLLALEV